MKESASVFILVDVCERVTAVFVLVDVCGRVLSTSVFSITLNFTYVLLLK